MESTRHSLRRSIFYRPRRDPVVAASSRERIFRTGNFEHTERTEPSAESSRACASATLMKTKDMTKPGELATGLKASDAWVYEKARGRCN
jgi:hypothetical protein